MLMAAVPEKKQNTNRKNSQQKILDSLKKGKIQLVLDTSKTNFSSYSKMPVSNNVLNLDSFRKVTEKTFFETLLSIISPIISILAFFSMLFSTISGKSATQEKFPIFSFLLKAGKSFKSTIKVTNPPGHFFARIADLLPKKHRESLEQEISDMRLEYYEAVSEKNIWRARFIIAFYYIGLGWSVVMWSSDKVKKLVGLVPKKD